MKQLILMFLCSLSVSAVFAQSEKTNAKINYKTEQYVDLSYDDGAGSGFMTVCRNCSREIYAACQSYTSTYSNEAYCQQIGSDPKVTQACYRSTSTHSAELLCLQNQTPPDVMRGCQAYTSTHSNERLCLQLRVSPYDAQTCMEYTSTHSEEANCLLRCASNSRGRDGRDNRGGGRR